MSEGPSREKIWGVVQVGGTSADRSLGSCLPVKDRPSAAWDWECWLEARMLGCKSIGETIGV